MNSSHLSNLRTVMIEVFMPYIGLTLLLCNIIYYIYNYFN